MVKSRKHAVLLVAGLVMATAFSIRAAQRTAPSIRSNGAAPQRYVARGGSVSFNFDHEALRTLGLRFLARGQVDQISDAETSDQLEVTFDLDPASTLHIAAHKGARTRILDGRLLTRGAFLFGGTARRTVVGNLVIIMNSGRSWTIADTLPDSRAPTATFELTPVVVDFDSAVQDLQVIGDLTIVEAFAELLGLPDAAGTSVGTVVIDGAFLEADDEPIVPSQPDSELTERLTAVIGPIGPDVIALDLQSVLRWGRVGDITAYSVGTTSCNIGDEEADWINLTNQHPVIGMNMYRLKADRFEQIGMSWIKHGFFAVDGNACDLSCQANGDGNALGVNCSDPYSANLNGQQNNMSPRSQANAFTGVHSDNWTDPGIESVIDRRLQVHDADLDPDLNPDAKYFVQGNYILADDTAAGNNDNNASYRRVNVVETDVDVYGVVVSGMWPTQTQQPAVRAWQDEDASVEEVDIPIPGEGLLILAAKAIDLGTGFWRYSYALQNLNSDLSVRSFSVPIAPGVNIAGSTFHDVDFHSGEPYDSTDWPVTVATFSISWSTSSFAVNPNANALRYGLVYSFSFDANVGPDPTMVTLGLFKPGGLTEVTANIVGPSLTVPDCNQNGTPDVDDILAGTSVDCDGNDVPDECQLDCNENQVADTCDTDTGTSQDCNLNFVPDECETDCDGNGIPDDCDLENGTYTDLNGNTVPDVCDFDCDGDGIPSDIDDDEDWDGDGIDDCLDSCPFVIGQWRCVCPEFGECCFCLGGCFCEPNISRQFCIDNGGTPDCVDMPCRDGCQLGDVNMDGTLDLQDVGALQTCFSGSAGAPGYVEPSSDCLFFLDFDGDNDIDPDDYKAFEELYAGPQDPL